MDDREMLELASKAGGIDLHWNDAGESGYYENWRGMPQWMSWNPLADDGDALRLAVHMFRDIHFWYFDNSVSVGNEWRVVCGDDPCAATRRAIVRAAAAIEKLRKGEHV